MLELILIELFKIFKKWRSYIGFIAIGFLVPIIQVAMYFEGQQYLDFLMQNLQQSFVFVGNLLNAYLISFIILQSLLVHVPFLVTLVAGDLLAGEATAGTYRILITRPISRFQIVTSKYIAGVIYTFLLIIWLALISLGIGVMVFGTGELIVIKSKIIIFAKNDVLWRFIASYSFGTLSMIVVASLAFLFSSLVENAIGPIISTMAIIIISLIISNIDVQIFKIIKPYLFTNYMLSWLLFFDDPVEVKKIVESVIILVVHILILYGITLYIFNKKDILT